MTMGTGTQAGAGCPPWPPVSPESSRAGSVLDFRVVETGPTFLRLAWQPGPEPLQGYSLSYAVQGEGTVPTRGQSCFCRALWAGQDMRTWQGLAW